jgi:signal peptidase I
VGSHTGYDDERDREPPRIWVVREYVETILVCVLFVVFARAFVVQPSEIPSGSMEDTLLVGDYVLVNRFIYAPTSFDWERRLLPARSLRRGDVVVFKHPEQPDQDFIKRLIARPGETVELRGGTLLVDGVPIDEPYVNPLYDMRDDFGPLLVPPGRFFVMGDHRNNSVDSRNWGTVPQELIKGRAFLILLSTRGASTVGSDPGRVTATSILRKLFNLAFRLRIDRCLTPVR